ncbi:hypothetical protein EVAR_35241_1 [Eumeta japonica]|uniref:Uncharacterized protein n=1 Tax=Eumeta variegata TaxID=151549 RepID=A0A4C1VEJ2_EUMVA|nr:hypothetical protein EVAR_35241_1 [Eumeta japonica]
MTELVWETVGEQVGCSGPWMESALPHCDNYTQIRDLISAYIGIYEDHEKWRLCPRLCHTLLYNAYVTNRQREYWWDDVDAQWRTRSSAVQYQTQLYLHFNSMMVSVYEERYNYDWNLFLSDLGGSIVRIVISI